jgi:hypothetical protein
MMADGFLPARTYMEWGELAVVPTRARLVARREGNGVKVQNALGAPIQGGYLRIGKQDYTLPQLADGAEGMAIVLESRKPKEEIADLVGLPLGMKRRERVAGPAFLRPLEEGHFLAQMGGMGFGPLAAMKVQLHEGIHYVRGQVDKP